MKIKNFLAAASLAIREGPNYLDGKLPGETQDESKVTIANKIKPEEEHIDLTMNGEKIVNLIRGLSLTPGAYLFLDGSKFKVYQAKFISKNLDAEIGQIVNVSKCLEVKVPDGVISLEMVQPEGKKMMNIKSFLNGAKDLLGTTSVKFFICITTSDPLSASFASNRADSEISLNSVLSPAENISFSV